MSQHFSSDWAWGIGGGGEVLFGRLSGVRGGLVQRPTHFCTAIWCRCLLCNKNIYVLIAGLICIILMLSDLKGEESNKGQLKRLIWGCHVLHRNMFFFCQLNGQKVYLHRRGHPENFISLVSMNQTSDTWKYCSSVWKDGELVSTLDKWAQQNLYFTIH